ncbi:MAG: EVE domain-containing protein [SAR202 cluster bacterium]|nr:EVE domain-containing protein [SAR202 cluster bacterium]
MTTGTPRNYWMVAIRPEYYEVARKQGFTLLGMGRAQKKRVQRMEIGDRVLFYVSDAMRFAATATVASEFFEDETLTWPSLEQGETFPWRVKLTPNVVLDERRQLDARIIGPRMEYVRKWTPERWPLAFVGPLHLIPKRDFQFIEFEMQRRHRPASSGLPRYEPRDDYNCVLESMAAEEMR